MTTHDFAVWLHGFTELTNGEMPTKAQWDMIVEHLDLAFGKVTKPLAETEKKPGPKTISIEEAQEALRKKAAEQAEQQRAARQRLDDLIRKSADTPKNVPGAMPIATPEEIRRKRDEEYYKDRTREVPFFPSLPQPFVYPGGDGYVKPFPYYQLSPNLDANKFIC